MKLTIVNARATALAAIAVDIDHVAGWRQHRNAILPGLHCAAAAGTAIANRVKPVQHGVFEKSMMHMPPLMFRRENIHCLLLADPAGAPGMMFNYETGKRLANYETDIQWLTGSGA